MTENHENDRPSVSLADRVRSLQLPKSGVERRGGGAWLPWLLCLALAGVAGYLGYRQFGPEGLSQESNSSPVQTTAEESPEGPSAKRPAEAKPGAVVNRAGGYIVPFTKSQVSPKVGGQIVELFIEEGQFVKKGQILAKLDRTEYEFEHRRMAALAEQAKARYEELKNGSRAEEKKHSEAALREAEAAYRQLQDESNRLRQSSASIDELVKIDSRVTQAQFKIEQLRQMDKMMQDGPRKERIDAALAEYQHAVAQRDKAKYYLDNTDVVSQIDGVILEKKAEVGDTVRPESFGQGLSASLCTMADLTNLEVDVDVSERDMKRVFKGQKCKIHTEAFPDVIYDGHVARLMPQSNRSKASVSVRVKIAAKPGDLLLRPEMRAQVEFLAPDKDAPEKEKSGTD
jgi:HlyD family secretion protein